MYINEISQFTNNEKYPKQNLRKISLSKSVKNKNVTNVQGYYMPVFTARVEKGMKRFYEFNKHRMPETLLTYLEAIPDKFSLSPCC